MKKKLTFHRETLRQLSLLSIKGIQGGTGITLTDFLTCESAPTKKSVCADNFTGVDPNG
jgi:hypothetical protein